MIQVALNGARAKGENSAIPFTVAEMAESARAAVAAGAGSVHFHVRGADGKESIAPPDVAAAVEAMSVVIPGVPVGVSTAEWIEMDSSKRCRLASEWTVLPDFVSINFNEIGSV